MEAVLILAGALILLTIYLIWVVKTYGIPKSISVTDYLNTKYKNAFEVVLFLCGASLNVYGYLNSLWSMVASGLFIIGVAIYSDFEKSPVFRAAHMTCAFTGFTLFGITPWLQGDWVPTAVTAGATILTYLLTPKASKIWWSEITVILFSFAGVLYTNIW